MGNNSLALKWFEPDNSTQGFTPFRSSIVEIAFPFTNCFPQFSQKVPVQPALKYGSAINVAKRGLLQPGANS